MNDLVLSVIIPLYNVEAYIDRLFDMVSSQLTNQVEIVFVDDGSKDNSVKRLEKLIQKISNSLSENILVVKQENKGCSVARNSGLHSCNGKYVTFIDADDTIKDDYFCKLIELIQKAPDYDMWFTGVSTYNERGELYETCSNENRLINNRKDVIDALVHGEIAAPYSMWSKIIRKDFLTQHGIQFYEDAKCMSDGLFYSKCFEYVERICLSEYVGYEWRRREGSISATYYDNTPELVVRYYGNVKKMYDSVPELKTDSVANVWLLNKEKFVMDYSISKFENGRFSSREDRKKAVKKILSLSVSQRVIDEYYSGVERLLFTLSRKHNSYLFYVIMKRYKDLKRFFQRVCGAIKRRIRIKKKV